MQNAKAYRPIETTEVGIMIVFNTWQLENDDAPIRVTEVGMTKDVMPTPENALSEMLSREVGIKRYDSAEQPSNAALSIMTTDVGRFKYVSDEHARNAAAPMLVMVVGIKTETSSHLLLQEAPENELFNIDCSDVGIEIFDEFAHVLQFKHKAKPSSKNVISRFEPVKIFLPLTYSEDGFQVKQDRRKFLANALSPIFETVEGITTLCKSLQ